MLISMIYNGQQSMLTYVNLQKRENN